MRFLPLALATSLALFTGEAFAAPHNPHPKRPQSHADNKVVAKRTTTAGAAKQQAKRQVISDFPPKTNATFSAGERYVIMDNDWGEYVMI